MAMHVPGTAEIVRGFEREDLVHFAKPMVVRQAADHEHEWEESGTSASGLFTHLACKHERCWVRLMVPR